jgi:hypothetical protein
VTKSSDKNDANHPVKKAFEEELKNFEIKNSEFTIIHPEDKSELHESIDNWINNHLKEENHFIDFVVLGYNPLKYGFNKSAENTTVSVLKKTPCSVFFDH